MNDLEARRPSVAGQFYAGSPETLRDQIRECFESKLGPGLPPEEHGDEGKVLGVVVPHAGYAYSGPVAAWSYRALYEDRRPQTFVILGPNHHGMGSGVSIYPKGAWKTPLGTAVIDEELSAWIVEETKIIDPDTRAHQYEHSIEVQIPFLQYLYGDIRLVAISMMLQDLGSAREVGREIGRVLEAGDGTAVVIASTDFSHYVSPEVAHENDHAVIERIVAMDSPGIYKVVEDRGVSMCGYGPVMAAIEATKALGAKAGRLLKYGTSGDVAPMREVVGYASIAFERA